MCHSAAPKTKEDTDVGTIRRNIISFHGQAARLEPRHMPPSSQRRAAFGGLAARF